MILLDMSQVMIANLMQQSKPGEDIEPDLIRHMVLNSVRMYKQSFEGQFGRLILCFDGRQYWRRAIFPPYKYHRKKDRDDSGYDWSMIFETINKLKDEFKAYLPFQVLHFDDVEADDIIAVLTAIGSRQEKVLILSGDKDFGQLQKYKNVKQFAPIQKEYIKIKDPAEFLKLHIMKGDRGDGIPNFLSSDTCLKDGKRQNSLSSSKVEQWLKLPIERFCTTDMMKGWKRNESLIDLDKIPEEIKRKIVTEFNQPFVADSSKLFEYFMKFKLNRLLGEIHQLRVKAEHQSALLAVKLENEINGEYN